MARLVNIAYVPRLPQVEGERIRWQEARPGQIDALPQICWNDGRTWSEANLWALQQATSKGRSIETVDRSMSHLAAYADWLESENVNWWHFPEREDQRCLTMFRGALVSARDASELAPSTTSQRMATVIRFYRWLKSARLLTTEWPIWQERQIGIRLKDNFGFEHTLRVTSTDLAIPNKKVAGAMPLEDGLLPVSIRGMNQILQLSETDSSEELQLMLLLGFCSGLRLGTIIDLKVQTILNAALDPAVGWHRLSLGPAARPPVATKFGVSGMVPILANVLERARSYAASTRRLKRQAIAAPEHRDLLFLNRNGKPYGIRGKSSINVAMTRLRAAGLKANIDVLRGFHFHRTRATFATELMRVALRCMPVADAIDFVRESCLHKSDKTTFLYVNFIEKSKGMAQAADEFTEAFLGLASSRRADV